jgi:heptosyltransferase-2
VAVSLAKNYEILILGGPGEENIAADIEQYLIKKNVKNYTNLAAKTSVSELISEINNLDLLITGDSGPMHIAAAFNVPTISIFGPTKDNETSQWMNEKSVVVKKNLECQPCMKRTCPLNHHNCMKLIEAAEVLKAINSLN